MKTIHKIKSNKNIIQLFFVLILLSQTNFIQAQCTAPKGAQSNVFGVPFADAFFTTPKITGATAVCTGQTTSRQSPLGKATDGN